MSLMQKLKTAYGTDRATIRSREFRATGIPQLDRLIGGGLMQGRAAMFWGGEHSGKTTLALQCCHAEINRGGRCLFLDLERALDIPSIRRIIPSFDPANLNDPFCYYKPANGEDAIEMIALACSEGVGLIVVDSVPYLIPRKVTEKDVGEASVSPVAGLLSREMPRIIDALDISGATCLFLQQARDNQNATAWGKRTRPGPGGRTVKHAISLSIELTQIKAVNPATPNVRLHKLTIDKSRQGGAFYSLEIEMFPETGFDPVNSLLALALQEGAVIRKGAWYYLDQKFGDHKWQGVAQAREALTDSKLYSQLYQSLVADHIGAYLTDIADPSDIADPVEDLFS